MILVKIVMKMVKRTIKNNLLVKDNIMTGEQ